MCLASGYSELPETKAMYQYHMIQIHHPDAILGWGRYSKKQRELAKVPFLGVRRLSPRYPPAKYERLFELSVLRLPKNKRSARFFYVLGTKYIGRGQYDKALNIFRVAFDAGDRAVKQMVFLEVAALTKTLRLKRPFPLFSKLKQDILRVMHTWPLEQRLAIRRLLYVIEHEPKQIGQATHKWLMPWVELRYDIEPYYSGFRFVLNRNKTQRLIRLKIGYPVP